MIGEAADRKTNSSKLVECKKGPKFKKQGHNLVEHSTGWGTQKDSALWIRQKSALGLAKLKF